MNLIQMWRAWRAYEEVKDMDKKSLIKLGVAAVASAVATASAQYVASDVVNFSAVISAVLTTVFAFLQKSPLAKD